MARLAWRERVELSGVIRIFDADLLPEKLPMPIARCGGTAWHRLGSHEPACHRGDEIDQLSDSGREKRPTTSDHSLQA